MKKLVLLFSVIFFGAFISAQAADGSYESGYRSGFHKVAGEYPKVIPINPQWQSLDQGSLNAAHLSSEKNDYKSNLRVTYGKGYKRGEEDAKHAVQVTDTYSSKNQSSTAEANKNKIKASL